MSAARRRTPVPAIVAVSLGGVALVLGALYLVARAVADNPGNANLGAEVVRLQAERSAERIDETGPYPLQDPDGDRDVYLQHVGDDPMKGWVLVLAYPPGVTPGDKRCALTWDVERDVFVAPCDNRTYPADGTGLTTFPAPVEDGRVVIDMRGG